MKIALITDVSSRDVLMARCIEGWIESLASQSHQLRIYTNYSKEETELQVPSAVEVVRPFTKWHIFEFIRTVPVIVQQQPEVLLFIPTTVAAERIWHPRSWTWLLLHTLGKVVQPLPRLAPLQLQSQESLRNLQSWLEAQSDMNITLEPIFLPPLLKTSTHVQTSTHELASKENYILVPGPVDQISALEELATVMGEACLQDSSLEFIFEGDWGRTPVNLRQRFADILEKYHAQNRWHLTGWNKESEFGRYQTLVRSADAVWLVHSIAASRDKILMARYSLHSQTPVALASSDQILIKHDVGTAFLDSTKLAQIHWLAHRESRDKLKLALQGDSSLLDQQSNLLNRNLFRLLSLHGQSGHQYP